MRKLNKKLKHQKNQLSFQTSKVMKWLRTPKDIWDDLIKEFNFTVDCCASDQNHLLPKYYTIKDDCLTKDWSGEIAYIHPLFDGKIGKFVEKAYHTKNFTGVFLLPASTHTKYFHDFILTISNTQSSHQKQGHSSYHQSHLLSQ